MSPVFEVGKSFDFGLPVRIYCGEGLLDRLKDVCPEAKRVLLVTGRGFAGASGLVDRVRRAFKGKSVELFREVESNPSIETVERGAVFAGSMHVDLVVGVGGGSALDAAKCIAVLASNREGFRGLLGRKNYANPPVRMVAVPTTCGTGSEANRYAIITDPHCNDKVTFESQHTYPVAGILDPSVLETLPSTLLVETACDAFTHAFEGYTSRRSQPLTDTLALEAMALIVRNLPPAKEGDRAARATLLYAACMAGVVIDHTATTMLHAMGYYLTLKHGVPHGKANAMFLPALFSYLEHESPGKLRHVYDLFPMNRRGPEGIKHYLRDLGIDVSALTCGMNLSETEQFADYVLGRKNTACTAGTVTREILVQLLRWSW
ncbi:MAG: iron-containing alcohol dehydrogenase [bacterium]